MPQVTERNQLMQFTISILNIRFGFPLSHPQCIRVYSCQRSTFKQVHTNNIKHPKHPNVTPLGRARSTARAVCARDARHGNFDC